MKSGSNHPLPGKRRPRCTSACRRTSSRTSAAAKAAASCSSAEQMLRRQGREMTMFEVAQWMVERRDLHARRSGGATRGLKSTAGRKAAADGGAGFAQNTNPAIEVDLRRYLRADHPELHRRGISAATCRYLGCGFLPQRAQAKASSPLNSRLVFQIRALRENGHGLEAVIVSHTGRALSREQEQTQWQILELPVPQGLGDLQPGPAPAR